MRKKIGILTFHDSINYGAVFQTYALQKTINEESANECEIIDYKCEKISGPLRLKRMMDNHSIKGIAKILIASGFYKLRNERFAEFRSKYCNLSKRTYNRGNISEANSGYDCFISGSDQIFNLSLTGNDYTYYLDFTEDDKTRIAYAASMGNFNFEGNPVEVSSLISRFDKISCREQVVVDGLKAKFGVEGCVALDPTFLLPLNCWIEMEEKIKVPEKFLLLYLVSPKEEYLNMASKIGISLNMPVYYINYTYKRTFKKNIVNMTDVSPERFLYLMHHASFVLTNSFHGTAMSVIYEKRFYVICDPEREAGNQRIFNILGKIGLNKRVIQLGEIPGSWDIDYSIKNESLPNLVEESIAFLKKSGVLDINE